jgi:flagellar hook-associated protein 2
MVAITSVTGSPSLGLTSSTGLASGIDTGKIIDAMIAAERASTAVEETRKSTLQTQLDAILAFNTRLAAIDDALTPLSSQSAFATNQATSSNAASLAVSADDTAAAGTYDIRVVTLAKAHQLVTASLADANASNGAGSLVVKLQSEATATIALTDTSLNGIAATINAANLGITASVINDGTGNRLLLRSQNTGLANQIVSFNATDDSDQSLKDLLPGGTAGLTTLTVVTQASDAQLRLGDPTTGLDITRASNAITDVIPGLTLNLYAATTDATTITVAKDTSATKDAIESLIKNVNDAIGLLGNNTKFDPTTNTAGPLIADADLTQGLNDILSALTGNVTGAPAQTSSLYALGVTIDQTTGQLSLDESVLDAKLASDPEGVKALVSGAATAAHSRVTGMTDSTYGSATLDVSTLQQNIQDITDQVAKADERLAIRRQSLQEQFTNMEMIIAGLNSQNSVLTSLINSLQTVKSSGSA